MITPIYLSDSVMTSCIPSRIINKTNKSNPLLPSSFHQKAFLCCVGDCCWMELNRGIVVVEKERWCAAIWSSRNKQPQPSSPTPTTTATQTHHVHTRVVCCLLEADRRRMASKVFVCYSMNLTLVFVKTTRDWLIHLNSHVCYAAEIYDSFARHVSFVNSFDNRTWSVYDRGTDC